MRGTSTNTPNSHPCAFLRSGCSPVQTHFLGPPPSLLICPSYKAHILCLAKCPLGVSKALHLAGEEPLGTLCWEGYTWTCSKVLGICPRPEF